MTETPDTTTSDAAAEEGHVITPEDLIDWVEHLASVIESVNTSRGMFWCSQWWNHPEAVLRFRALYEKWTEAQEENSMSSWWVDHFDRHASVLFTQSGPFGDCNVSHEEKKSRSRILTTEQPPSGWSWDT